MLMGMKVRPLVGQLHLKSSKEHGDKQLDIDTFDWLLLKLYCLLVFWDQVSCEE